MGTEQENMTVNESEKASQGLKLFLLSVCRLHKENNFNRFETTKLHNKVDDMIKEDKKETKAQVFTKVHYDEIKRITEHMDQLSSTNQKLIEQMNSITSENKVLKEKVKKIEEVPMHVTLKSKEPGKPNLVISQMEYKKLQELKEKIDAYENLYSKLEKEENYDEKLLLNYRERIEILKEKLRTLSA